MEVTYDRVHLNALRHPGTSEYHEQLSAADPLIDDPSGVAAVGLYVSNGLGLTLLQGAHAVLTIPLRERTETSCSPLFENASARGVLISVYVDRCECQPQEGIVPWLEMVEPFSLQPVPLHDPCKPIALQGVQLLLFHSDYEPMDRSFRQVARVPIPSLWRVRVEHKSDIPIAYTVTHSYLC